MGFQRIGIGDRRDGFSLGKAVEEPRRQALIHQKDRGETSRKRAENAGVKSLPSVAQLVNDAEMIVSIVIPSAAKRVADKIAEAAAQSGRKNLLYFDANAISPMTSEYIAGVLTPAGVSFIDGCIIGAASRMGKGTIVYVSGGAAEHARDLEPFGIPVRVLVPNTSQASAFKVVDGGSTKEARGLSRELLTGAQRFG